MGLAGSLFRAASRLAGGLRRPRPAPDLPLAAGSRVLLSRADHLGDLLMALPALEALAASGLEVDLLVKRPHASLVANHPRVAAVHAVTLPWQDTAGRGDGWGRVVRLRRELKARRYAAVIEATEDLRSQALLASLGCFSVGWELPGSPAFLDRACRPSEEHQVERTLELAAALQVAPVPGPPRLPGVAAPPRRAGVLIHPGAAGPRKAWPLARFRALAAALRGEGHQVSFLLGPADEELREALAGEDFLPRLSLPELATRLAGAQTFVGNDSGPAHLAAAVGTPVTVVFGPTMPGRTAPRGPDVRVVAAGLPCQPCWAPRTPFHCPTSRECLGDLPVAPVLAAALAQLSAGGPSADEANEEAP